MENTEMIYTEEVLELAHHKMGYGKDDLSKEVFHVLIENENDHYLIKPKKMREYIEKYIDRKYKEINGRLPISYEEEDTIIKIEGSTQGTKYSKNNILNMLVDEHVTKLLFNRLKKRSTYFGRTPIASDLSKFEIAMSNGIITDKDQISFFEMIKNDSLDEMKEKLNILQKSIEINECIMEISEKEMEETVKGLEEMETMKQTESDAMELEKILEWEKEFEEMLQLEIGLEKDYCYLSPKERLVLENRYEELN